MNYRPGTYQLQNARNSPGLPDSKGVTQTVINVL